MNVTLPPAPSASVFADRRRRAARAIDSGVMVLEAAPIQYSSRDNERPYVADRELYYLTGLAEPESVAVLVGGEDAHLVLFVRERDAQAELWAGPRLGVDGAAELVRPDACHPLGELADRLPELMGRGRRIHYALGRGGPVERMVVERMETTRSRGARAGVGPRGVIDPGEVLDEMRLFKDTYELEALRAAGAVSAAGHLAGARVMAPGVGEYEIEAAVDAAFRSTGAAGPGYDTIVGSGTNACVLHYVRNGDRVGENDLVLVDAGAEVSMYRGDITRTYPASGRFTSEQREIYELVDAARAAAIAAVKPGATIGQIHETSTRVLTEGLVELGVLDGDVDALIEAGDQKRYFPHQTSHWLGLDVHDPGDYVKEGQSRRLEPGMVFTVEPGLYFQPGEDAVERYAGIGVRIEDNVAVTESGCDVLTDGVPTSASEVESLVRG